MIQPVTLNPCPSQKSRATLKSRITPEACNIVTGLKVRVLICPMELLVRTDCIFAKFSGSVARLLVG